RRRIPVCAGRCQHGLLLVDDERRAEFLREGRGGDPPDGQLAVLDGGAVGEEPGQSIHQSWITSASPGPVFGAPITIISAPSGPASKLRTVSLCTRSASHCFRSMISSSSFARRVPLTST